MIVASAGPARVVASSSRSNQWDAQFTDTRWNLQLSHRTGKMHH